MLQEAGNSAYSWWVASHIRTKQSKWLEQSLQEMEENVSAIIKLISEDGDSFAKRAEMYYERRPELLDFVEESYRIYRALAERYDHISTELQNANNTLASAFPERLQFAVNDDDDKYGSTQIQIPKRRTGHPIPNPKTNSTIGDPKQQLPTNNIKSIIALTATTNNGSQPPPKKAGRRKGSKAIDALRSGLKKAQALGEIEKLQKSVLTDEEFMGSSYGKSTNGVARYDKGIMDPLQDEFTVRKTIEDNGARNLMIEAATKSYNHGLTELRDKHPELSMNVNQVRQRINIYNRNEQCEQQREKEAKIFDQPNHRNKQVTSTSQAKEIEVLGGGNMKEQFPSKGDSSISVSGMVEKIDELAAKVSNLESVVSSQTAIIPRLREERVELQAHIQSLENDKADLMDGNNILSENLKETEHKLKELRELDHIPHTRNDNFQRLAKESSGGSSSSSSSSTNNLDLISQSQKLSDLNQDEEIGENESKSDENAIVVGNEPTFLPQQSEPNNLPARKSLQGEDLRAPLMGGDESCYIDVQRQEHDTSNDMRMFPPMEVGIDVSIIQQGEEHSSCCKPGEMDDNGEDSLAELRELRNENAIKDEEIQSLQQKLDLLQQKLEDQYKNIKEPTKEDDTSNGKKDEYMMKLMHEVDEIATLSPVEAKLRESTDEILEQNLDFWVRFSCSLCEIDKFRSRVENLRKDVAVMAEESETKSEVDARTIIYDDLKEIQSKLTVWSTKSMALKDELQCRFSQLCRVQQDITTALNDEAIGDEMQFTSLHAAKFQGEVLNMKQENVRVADKLQASLDDVTNLQTQVEGIIDELNRRELGRTESSKGSGHLGWKNQAPIRSFISKLKLKRKQKESIFSDVHPTFHIKYQPLTY